MIKFVGKWLFAVSWFAAAIGWHLAPVEGQQRLLESLRQWREQTHDPRLEPSRLVQLTAEQDAAAANYPKYEPDFTWKYAEYLDLQPPTR